MTKQNNSKQIKEEIKKLVIERIKSSSDNFRLIGGGGEKLSKKEVITSIQKNEKIGKEIVRVQMEFIRAMANGELYT